MLQYEIKSCGMTANGKEIDANNFSNHGGYVYADTPTAFFLPPLNDFDISQSPVKGVIEYEIEYHAVPKGPIHKSKKRMSYQFDVKSGDNAYLVLEEDEQ